MQSDEITPLRGDLRTQTDAVKRAVAEFPKNDFGRERDAVNEGIADLEKTLKEMEDSPGRIKAQFDGNRTKLVLKISFVRITNGQKQHVTEELLVNLRYYSSNQNDEEPPITIESLRVQGGIADIQSWPQQAHSMRVQIDGYAVAYKMAGETGPGIYYNGKTFPSLPIPLLHGTPVEVELHKLKDLTQPHIKLLVKKIDGMYVPNATPLKWIAHFHKSSTEKNSQLMESGEKNDEILLPNLEEYSVLSIEFSPQKKFHWHRAQLDTVTNKYQLMAEEGVADIDASVPIPIADINLGRIQGNTPPLGTGVSVVYVIVFDEETQAQPTKASIEVTEKTLETELEKEYAQAPSQSVLWKNDPERIKQLTMFGEWLNEEATKQRKITLGDELDKNVEVILAWVDILKSKDDKPMTKELDICRNSGKIKNADEAMKLLKDVFEKLKDDRPQAPPTQDRGAI